MKRALLVLALAVALAAPARAGFEEGEAAFRRGDYAAALREFRPLAEQGAARAQAVLSVIYAEGRGVAQDLAEAAKWARLAAEQGHAKSQYNLGSMYANGRGVAQDSAEAAKWFRLAAAQGDPLAQAALGVMYADGQGVARDYVRAHMWLNLAVANPALGGFPDAFARDFARERDALARKMTPAEIAEASRLAREFKPTR